MTPKDICFKQLESAYIDLLSMFKKVTIDDEGTNRQLRALKKIAATQFAEYNAIIAKERAAEKIRLIGEQAVKHHAFTDLSD